MSSNKRWLIGGITTAALAGAYIFWGPSRSKRNRRDCIKGLENMGNTCFLNSVLQALAPCNFLTEWISRHRNKSAILMSTLSDILKGLNNENVSGGYLSPSEVLLALKSNCWVIRNEEQDAHELFHVLTTTLQEEASQHSPISLLEVNKIEVELPSSKSECSQLPGIASRVNGILPPSLAFQSSRVVLPTKGLLMYRLICRTCGFAKALRYDSFDSVSLTLPEPLFTGNVKLNQCLEQWTSLELVPDVVCVKCSQQTLDSKKRSTFTKQLCFGRLPDCLCLHLVRTVWLPTGTPWKRSEHVTFPEYLNLADYTCLPFRPCPNPFRIHSGLLGGANQDSQKLYCSASTTTEKSLNSNHQNLSMKPIIKVPALNHLYKLKSVIVHIGDTFSGHFITYRRGPKTDSCTNVWFCVSDMSVRQVPFSEVVKSSAYMLFYEKLKKVELE